MLSPQLNISLPPLGPNVFATFIFTGGRTSANVSIGITAWSFAPSLVLAQSYCLKRPGQPEWLLLASPRFWH